ncbi:MAG: hypothetical protein MR571_05155 [Succinatimonas sp.]|nr:hypothetical protein [Succinatimonas sp.]HAH71151.1 hypothetical protein [Succinivibrionaceae bacterium]
MEEQKDSMTPKEQMLIGQLQELLSAAEKTATALRNTREELDDRERETAALRRSMIELKEENQHLREVLQTWRQRLDAVLSQLKALN